jgi:hypothetical protein
VVEQDKIKVEVIEHPVPGFGATCDADSHLALMAEQFCEVLADQGLLVQVIFDHENMLLGHLQSVDEAASEGHGLISCRTQPNSGHVSRAGVRFHLSTLPRNPPPAA